MSVFQLGPIIRNRRIELGLSQEDLADGICSVPTLSRIENGERMPTKNHFEMLMQRLGYSAMSLDFFTDKQDFLIHELKFKIRQAYVAKDFALAKRHLDEFKKLINEKSNIDQQFLLLYQTFLNLSEYTNQEKIDILESALRLTCPAYSSSRFPHVLSYEEIILLNGIAVFSDNEETRDRTITILRALKKYYDDHIINSEEALRTQPMILYNLSKALGSAGYYDECLEICDQSIHLARKTSRCSHLGKALYNRAWVLMKRNQEGDRASAVRYAKQSRDFFKIMGDTTGIRFVDTFIEKYGLVDEEPCLD